ncbi:MAG: hypothetical protein Q7U88_12655 [Desulfocapsaceae bacterium]|nr:hypothetical protein [Desulfocapsaceae bacterium]
MEPLTIFASTVGIIGAFHLLSTTVERFGKGIYNRENMQAKRDDWYCFFQLSALFGEGWETNEKMDTQQLSITETKRLEQKRRQQANRPRLQV